MSKVDSRIFPRELIAKVLPKVVVIAGVLVVIAIWALVPRSVEEVPAVEPRVEPVRVEVVTAEAELPDTFEVPGIVEPNRVVAISAEVSSRVERILVDEGQTVTAGEVLVELNTDLLRAEVDRATAQAELDQREYERAQRLRETGSATLTELDQARARAEASTATLAEARARLDRATIRASIDGVLNSLPVELGEYVQSGTQVAQLVDISMMKVAVDVPERDIGYMQLRRQEEIVVDPVAGRTVTGTITFIAELADPSTRTTRVEITVDNRARVLRSGQIVRARLLRRVMQNVIMIPLQAVIPLEDGRVVYTVDENNLAQQRRVELGIMKGRRVQVTEGLSGGERLIVSGHQYVGPGQPVAIVE